MKQYLKTLLMAMLCLFVGNILTAQENAKQREVGLTFYNLEDFGITFKTGTNKSLWRFSTLSFSGSNHFYDDLSSANARFGFGFRVGKEYRKNIAENFELRYGADLLFQYRNSKFSDDISDPDNKSIRKDYLPGINLVLGFNYVFNDKIVLGAEFLPRLVFSHQTFVRNDSINNNEEIKNSLYSIQYGFSSDSVLLSLAYRF